MEEIIQMLQSTIMRAAQQFGYMDRNQLYNELAEFCITEADNALKMEYMLAEEEEDEAYEHFCDD